MASMTIRELEPARDAGQVVDLLLATNLTAVTNTDEWLHRRRAIPERAQMLSRVAELEGRIVGVVDAGVNFFGSGGVASIRAHVVPAPRTRGAGSVLDAWGLEHVHRLGAGHARAMSDQSAAGVAFATVRGWKEVRA